MSEQHDKTLVERVIEAIAEAYHHDLPAPDDFPRAPNGVAAIAIAAIDAVRAYDRERRPRGIVCAQCHGTGIVAVEDLELPPEPSDDEDRHTKRCLLFPSVSYYHEGCDGCFCVHGVCQECGAMLILRDAVKANESATPEP